MNASRTGAGAIAIAATIPLAIPADTHAKWCWEPPVQTTRAEVFDPQAPDSAGALGGHLAFGRGEGPWHLHRVYSPWQNMGVWYNGLDQYEQVDATLDWGQAWEAREDLTGGQISGTDVAYVGDGTLFVDALDRVHTTHEMWRGVGMSMDAGYRRRGHATWTGDPVVIASCAGSPRLWLEESTNRLHAVYRTHDPEDACGKLDHHTWLTHNWAPLEQAVDPGAWSHETFVTGVFAGGIPVVDGNCVIHVLASVDDNVGNQRRLRLLHAYGTPPAPPGTEWTNVTVYTVSETFSTPGALEEDGEEVSVVLATSGLRDTEEILVAFHRWEPTGKKESYIVAIDVAEPGEPSYSSFVRVSEDDGVNSVAPGLFRADNGDLHVIYTDPSALRPRTYDPGNPPLSHLYHRVNRGDPLQPGDWEPRTQVTWARRTTTQWPGFVADADTVWAVYACHDDDGPSPDLNWEGWFQRGYDLRTDNAAVPGERVTWSGTVNLDADFLVCPAGTLEVAAGTEVVFAADTDARNFGRDGSRAEIVVRGVLLVDGEPASPAVFRSGGQPGDWGGFYFAPGTDGSQSRIEYAEIRDAWTGVWSDGIAPSLGHLVFSGSEIADIFLPGDARIAPGSEWNLVAPTRVAATLFDYPTHEDTLGTAGVTDLIVLGSLITQSGAPQDTVWFESVAKDEVNGDDWGGITVAAGGTAILRGCSVGYALRGVYFAAAGTAVLEDSRVHHYAQEGVFDYGSDALIQRCTVERGANFSNEIQTTAIHTKASVAELRDNTIGTQLTYGIWLQFGKALCKDLPWGPVDTLRVVGNTVTGDGDTDRPGSAGIRGEYLCLNHATVVDDNTVTNWRGRAIDLYQTADVHVRCNRFEQSYAGAQYFRDRNWLQVDEEDVFWKQNSLKYNRSDNLRVLFETGLRFYDGTGGGALAGQNALRRPAGPNAWNVAIAGGSLEVEVDARVQTWYDANGNVLTDPAAIQLTNDPGPGTILVDNPLASEQLCGGGSAAALPGVPAALGDASRPQDSPEDVRPSEPRVPDRWSLDLAGANPALQEVVCSLAVPRPSSAQVTIYDVRGRRVRVLHDGALTAGYHTVRWDRTVEAGGLAPAGVYFLRAESPGFRQTRKVVLLPATR